MSIAAIIREIFYILAGILIIIFGIMYEIEWYYILAGFALIVWGIWDIYKEVRDLSKKSEVSEMAKEREEIKKKIEGKE
jgi:cytochrome c biogenesis protein CcdA